MSIFHTVNVPCPACGATVEFDAVYSLNADRRPDLRAAILDGSFQRKDCPQCSEEFRMEPEITYIDVGRGQWIAAYPIEKRTQWPQIEEGARATFSRAYGDRASAAAREIGAGMKARVVFGWTGLAEKLLAHENGLDDVILELTKTAMLRGMEKPPLAIGSSLRLAAVEEEHLIFGWISEAKGELRELLRVPRALYNDIAASPGPWESLRGSLTAGLFVDVNRLLLPTAAAG
jgi:hypothetical protein